MRTILLLMAFVAVSVTGSARKTNSVQPTRLHPEAFVKEVDGKTTALYTLRNKSGMEVSVTNLGARIVALYVPDRDGKLQDVVCGYDSIGGYLAQKQNFGAVVGRYIGRILGATYTLDGEKVELQGYGTGSDISHGGQPGFANRVWTAQSVTKRSLTLRYDSPDGESGFPGQLSIYVTYTLTSDNALRIDYRATTTRPTVLNPSNHSFFNISGQLGQDVLSQRLQIDADSICAINAKKQVTGEMRAVEGSAFDFRKPHLIGERIDDNDDMLKTTGGYDHCYQLKNNGSLSRPVASIYDSASGRTMEVYTTEPGMQIYSANGHKGNITGKEGVVYGRRNSICFETMHFHDSPNKPHFPSTALYPGQTFRSTTIYKFKAEK